MRFLYLACVVAFFDTPPNSLKDSNVNLKMKTIEKRIGVHFLAYNTLGVRGAC
jgi:hypothetical protein